jgi:hypothetical protein
LEYKPDSCGLSGGGIVQLLPDWFAFRKNYYDYGLRVGVGAAARRKRNVVKTHMMGCER